MLKEKVALVTGGARGIGCGIAKALAREGATVIVNYSGSKEKAEAVVKSIIENGGIAKSYQCDVADYTAVEKMIKSIVEKHGHLDILVNNAGITRDNLVMKMSETEFDEVIATNLKGSFNTMRHVARQMLKQRGGQIINISSVSGILGNAGQMNYAASKAGVVGMTKTMARELASRSITVNAIAPGFIETEMTEALSDSVKEASKAQIPLGRFGDVEDIAEMVVFLASNKAKYITGQVISVDGGLAI